MFWKNNLSIPIGVLLVILLMPLFGVFSQEAASNQLTAEQTKELQTELDKIEFEIAQYESQLSSVKSEKNTLNKKISQLKLQQSKLKAQIKQSTLAIKSLENQLTEVEKDIQARAEKVSLLNNSVAELIRQINQKDRHSILAILTNQNGLGAFFESLSEYKKISASLTTAVEELKAEQAALAVDGEKLNNQRDDQQNLLSIVSLQNKELASTLAERSDLLAKTKDQEKNYQAVLADRKKRAAQIKSRIYELLGISTQVTFGQALVIAQWAESQTGVRAAFLLAILTQESNLGKNVGTCNRVGDPPEKSWQVIMPGPIHYANYVKNGKSCEGADTPCSYRNDQDAFVSITSELGMDPDITPVSCPMKDSKGNRLGWGGAMGPAQFIPTTWLGYKAKVAALTGKAANPWDIRDAFAAAAIKLKADGAGSKSGEWAAAMKYFSGSTNTRYRFYGDNVAATAEKYQQDIDDLAN
ncbi:MAG: hypothetical protein WCV73_02470 [Patescibacteria group bacterium]|jgi:membrane-bound lytic murein transglycosylase B